MTVMFCMIKYVDYCDYQHAENEVKECRPSSTDNKTLLINPNCPIGILRDYISTEVRLSEDAASIPIRLLKLKKQII